MKFFLQVFLLFAFSFSSIFASDLILSKKIKLKKDQIQRIIVKYDGREKEFFFRWTLYKNNGLVMFRSYDKIVAQNILYLRKISRSFRVELKPSGLNFYNKPYLLVMFKDFDYKTRKAKFELFLSDDTKRRVLEYKKLKEG